MQKKNLTAGGCLWPHHGAHHPNWTRHIFLFISYIPIKHRLKKGQCWKIRNAFLISLSSCQNSSLKWWLSKLSAPPPLWQSLFFTLDWCRLEEIGRKKNKKKTDQTGESTYHIIAAANLEECYSWRGPKVSVTASLWWPEPLSSWHCCDERALKIKY